MLAETNLMDGRTVVADCVNPVAESRDASRNRRIGDKRAR
jgi:hypothetical protein